MTAGGYDGGSLLEGRCRSTSKEGSFYPSVCRCMKVVYEG